MFISLIIIATITVSGLCLTYFFVRDETILWRLAAGCIIGSTGYGLISFLISNLIGLSVYSIIAALAVSAIPILIFRKSVKRREFKEEWQRAKDKTQGISKKRIWRVSYYVFFLAVFVAFFDRAMIVGSDGIFTGASQNLGDLPYHLGAILSFTDANNFPPANPSFSEAKFTYPFIADFLTSVSVKLGAQVNSAMFIQNVVWAFSLLVILERFVVRITGNRLAGKIAPFILFFSGGLGFLWFFKDYWYGAQGIWEIIWNLPRDYTIGEKFRWGNSLITLFITQRSLLLGLPLTIIVVGQLWTYFREKQDGSVDDDEAIRSSAKSKKGKNVPIKDGNGSLGFAPPLILGLLAGTLPLVHAHSLAVLFVISCFLFVFSVSNWKKWIVFAIGVSVIAVPELLWIMAGSATRTSEFVAWHYGWHSQGENLILFWFKNTGLFIPLLLISLVLMFWPKGSHPEDKQGENDDPNTNSEQTQNSESQFPLSTLHLTFLLPFLFLFVISNVAKFAPWEWDNIKVLIYWFVGAIPFVAATLSWLWQKSNPLRVVAVACVAVLIFAGSLDVWRVASGQMRNGVFDRDAVDIAEEIKKKTEENALFLNAPTYNSAIALTGRGSLMRYIGHLSSHGIDYVPRENDLRRIYLGDASADVLLKKHNIDFVLISPKEREYMRQFSQSVNEQFFQKFPVVAEAGQYKVYRVK